MTGDNFLFTSDAPVRADVTLDASLVGTRALLSHYARQLKFPDYFGMNWDALFDCICDFSWWTAPSVTIDHAQLPQLPPTDLETYLMLLDECLRRRSLESSPRLEIVFRAADRTTVLSTVGVSLA